PVRKTTHTNNAMPDERADVTNRTGSRGVFHSGTDGMPERNNPVYVITEKAARASRTRVASASGSGRPVRPKAQRAAGAAASTISAISKNTPTDIKESVG